MDAQIPNGSCVCTVCGEEKDNSCFSFYKDRKTKDGNRLRVNTNCKDCQKVRSKEVQSLTQLHKGSKPEPGSPCQCCGKETLKFEIDHCHETGGFRGWVCKHCNVGFGKLGDNIDGVTDAQIYLLKSLSSAERAAKIYSIEERLYGIDKQVPEGEHLILRVLSWAQKNGIIVNLLTQEQISQAITN